MNFFTDRKFAPMRGQLKSEYWQWLIEKAIKKDGALDVWIIKKNGIRMSIFKPKEKSNG